MALNGAHQSLRMRDGEGMEQEAIECGGEQRGGASPKESSSTMVRLAARFVRVKRGRKTRVMLPHVEWFRLQPRVQRPLNGRLRCRTVIGDVRLFTQSGRARLTRMWRGDKLEVHGKGG